mgnify:FL=1
MRIYTESGGFLEIRTEYDKDLKPEVKILASSGDGRVEMCLTAGSTVLRHLMDEMDRAIKTLDIGELDNHDDPYTASI